MKKIVFFDLETGGVQPHHPNIQIAAIACNEQTGEEVDSFEQKIQFDVSACDPKALEINSYSKNPEAWANAVTHDEAMLRFNCFLSRHKTVSKVGRPPKNFPYKVAKLGGHNVTAFDFPRIKQAFDDIKTFLPADMMMRDTLALAVWWCDLSGQEPPNFRLTTLLQFFGIPLPGEMHDALTDVRACRDLWMHIRRAGDPARIGRAA